MASHARRSISLGAGQLAHGSGVSAGQIADHGARPPCHEDNKRHHGGRGRSHDAKHCGRRQAGNGGNLQMIEQRLRLQTLCDFTRFARCEQMTNVILRETAAAAPVGAD